MKLFFKFSIKPNVCDTFKFKNPNGWARDSSFRIDHWMKENERGRLVYCGRAEATYVSGYGVCGCIAHLDDIVIIGTVNWKKSYIKQKQKEAEKTRSWMSFEKPHRV